MLKQLREIVIARVQQRVAEGDCPTIPAESIETLENVIVDLAHPLPEQPQEGVREANAEAVTQALWKVVAYDQLLRRIGEAGPDMLFAGEMPNVDAVYDNMVASVIAALPKVAALHSPMSELQRMGEEFEAGAPNLDSYIAGREDEAEMRGWQLIETAPKGGGQFLAWHSADGICLVWNAETYWLYRGQNNLPGGLVDQAAACTHWLPLPAAPSSESKL